VLRVVAPAGRLPEVSDLKKPSHPVLALEPAGLRGIDAPSLAFDRCEFGDEESSYHVA
jgi:hypothetical protein